MLCACEHVPQKPIVEYDTESSIINIVQMDTAAHDTAYIDIENLYHKVVPIKDTIKISAWNSLEKLYQSGELNQIELAYSLVKQGNKLNIKVRTTRTNDTIFLYHYQTFEIKPINVAEIVSGTCRGFYDVNYNRNYYKYIRQWFFQKELTPDSTLIEKIHSILKQFNYSGKNEYGTLNGSVPIVSNISNLKFNIKATLPGKYFYLYSYPIESDETIQAFVESKIAGGLTDAYKNINSTLSCCNSGRFGQNILFLIGIDDNWKYDILPVGIVVIDDCGPSIYPKGEYISGFSGWKYSEYYLPSNRYEYIKKKRLTLHSHNILIHLSDNYDDITGIFQIGYGSLSGNDYFGYDIPFHIRTSGDVKTITIGTHKLNANAVNDKEFVRLHLRNLHDIPLTVIDARGNISKLSMYIPIHYNTRKSYNNNDYNDLESRVNDLESRMNEFE